MVHECCGRGDAVQIHSIFDLCPIESSESPVIEGLDVTAVETLDMSVASDIVRRLATIVAECGSVSGGPASAVALDGRHGQIPFGIG